MWKISYGENENTKYVTLKHLLSHTSGISPSGFHGYRKNNKIPEFLQILNGEKPSKSDPVQVTGKVGSGYRYSGGGYLVAQQVMMDKLNKPFEEIMDDVVFIPLGMNHSTYKQDILDHLKPNVASGHLVNGNRVSGAYNIYPELAAAGLWSTPMDILKALIDILRSYKGDQNTQLSKNATIQMLTPFISETMSLSF
jgi:CubicO group peptidase (beta-lactamase class C family)